RGCRAPGRRRKRRRPRPRMDSAIPRARCDRGNRVALVRRAVTHILGLNAFHGDAAACLLVDGRLVAAAEEERFRRVKHWAGFPREATRWCLEEAGLTLADVEHVAINQDARANIGRKLSFLARSRPDVSLILDRLRNK